MFSEKQFPVTISYGSSGGPMRPITVTRLRSGREHRNQSWQDAIRKYDASVGVKEESQFYELLDFWEGQSGGLYGFRWKDWNDYNSSKPYQEIAFNDQTIGQAVSDQNIYPLYKGYGSGDFYYSRRIEKPIEGTVQVGVNGQVGVENLDFIVDYVSGNIVFGFVPMIGTDITAGYEFDVPARFEDDSIIIAQEEWRQGLISSIGIIEIKDEWTSDLISLSILAQWAWLSNVDINTAVNVHWESTWGST